ncbi:high light inducible protein [Synechococcus sp. Tobar12-5m-g]|uniref:chlorophyll a/b-binding protein n=1 Tax=unclassified Synechococcus TaxID=2626047 RepID=UPI0020CD2E0B|nr:MULTISPECIES: chlorophyll a/b-binding protein [unclassified Synechococcus]MCP9773764.1 high light inducible protein [Synechococcus sp. Tobar12-5m-g]MCP9874763.1 high light inducible protein [Synechococcus sp. Cruz CV-v-12]
MTFSPANQEAFQESDDQQVLLDQLKRAELINGRAAMIGIVIGLLTEAITGSGIAHQIGLGPLVDGYTACRTQFLPFCF